MLRLIAILFVALLAACGTAQPAAPAQPAQPARSFPAQIDTVTVEIAESLPVQVFARLEGYLGDGCTSLGAITQSREGNLIEVSVLANHSGAEACTMIAQVIDERVQLEGEFPAGTYTVRVNGVEQTFQI